MRPFVLHLLAVAFWSIVICSDVPAQEFVVHEFETRQLSDVYYSEGANAGDLDGDGQMDVVCGPYWYRGPEFTAKYEIYKPVAQNLDGYADNFFSWVHDFDRDGNQDVLVVGFPGKPAYVYRNPGGDQIRSNTGGDSSAQHWTKHEVLDWVSNESPQFVSIVGDEMEELICTRDGFFGFATIDPADPLGHWTFHAISEQIAPPKFGHGLGVGDVNGDGRMDLLFSGGWFEQPKDDPETRRWKLHEVSFSNSYGGAEMYAYDVDGDGDNDVLTAHAAHDFGLAWYEQVMQDDGQVVFEHHLIMGDRPENNRYGIVFSELHSLALADVDGDGMKDLVTGKTYWSHHRQSPMWDADPVVYWFRLVRTDSGVDWIPYRAGNTSGIGRQLSVSDLNHDGLPDFVVGGMKGANVLIHSRKGVSREEWQSNQPQLFEPSGSRTDRGAPAEFNDQGFVAGAIEGETMKVVEATAGATSVQPMSGFSGDRWSGNAQLFWRQATPRARLNLEFEVMEAGDYEIGAVLTTARDYAMVNLQLDGVALGSTLDLYDYPDVRTTGVISFGVRRIEKGTHRLRLETIGANDSAVPSYMVGLDCLVLKKK